MEKYKIISSCNALSTNAISFTVAAQNLEDNVLAYGNIIINSNLKSSANINFYGPESYNKQLYNELILHCKSRASIVFELDSQERKDAILKQET